MGEIIKKGSAQYYIVEKEQKFLQRDDTFKDLLTDVDKFVDYREASLIAGARGGRVRTLEITEFKVY